MDIGTDTKALRNADRPVATGAALFALTLAGLALRVLSMDSRGLWLDEAVTVTQANQSVAGIIRDLDTGVHPPLYHILMHFWITAFGTGEIALRSFSVILGAVAIPAAFWAGQRLYDRRTGLVAAALVAFSPFQIWYSQEARMYELLFLAGLLSTAYLVLAVRENRARLWAGYLLWTLIGVFTHYFFAFLIAGQVVYYVFGEVAERESIARRAGRARAKWWKPWGLFFDVDTLGPWFLCGVVTLLAFAAWVYYAAHVQTPGENALVGSISGSGLGYGQEVPRLALRFNDIALLAVQMTVGFHAQLAMDTLVAMWPLAISFVFLTMHLAREMTQHTRLLLAGVAGLLLMLVIGQWQGQILASRYFMAVAGALWLLMAWLLARVRGRAAVWVAVVLAVVAGAAWLDQSYAPSNAMRYDNREALQEVSHSWRSSDTLIYLPFYMDPLTGYYLPPSIPAHGFPEYGAYAHLRDGQGEIDTDLRRVVGSSPRVWLFLSFQNITELRTDAYAVRYWLKHQGYVVTEDRPLNQVELLRYERTGLALRGQGSVASSSSTSAPGAVTVP